MAKRPARRSRRSTNTIGYLGSIASYSHQACQLACKHEYPGWHAKGYRSFADLFRAMTAGRIGAGIIPVENTIGGRVADNYRLLRATTLQITSELFLPIHHNLLGVPGARAADLKKVRSHPQALAQCATWLAEHAPRARGEPRSDTATAAKYLARYPTPLHGVIASDAAAGQYGLEILAQHIEDQPGNVTRFVVLGPGREQAAVLADLPAAARRVMVLSVMLTLRPPAQSLTDLLGQLGRAGLLVSKLETYPATAARPDVGLHLEVLAELDRTEAEAVLELIGQHASVRHLLGLFPADKDRQRYPGFSGL